MTGKMKVTHRPANAAAAPEEFPAGLRVLVVDDDATCLTILDHMLQRCRYRVTTCCQATVALSLLRERKGSYDVVISDVHMPDMDGFKLLEHVGLEMDLPVIMMSIDGGTDAVMKGIKHGACDYLIKPVRMEELKNIWQHVIRKKWNENKEVEHSGSLEDSDRHRRMVDDVDYASSVNDGAEGTWISQKKKRAVKEDEDDDEMDSADPTASKRPRVVWTVELHQQFVSAVNQLGIEKAVPKRILELMNVPGLSRENIASHLQKFRLYLKRLSGVVQHHGALPNSFCGPLESNTKMGPFGRLDFQALAAAGQIPPQTLAALHAELLRRPSGGSVFSGTTDKPVLLQAPIQGLKCIPMEPGVAYGQPLLEPGFSMCSRGDNNAINVQPSCVVPSPSSSFQIGISPGPMNGNNLATSSPASSSFHVGINPLSSQSSDIPFGGAQVSESSISYSLSRVDSCTSWGVHNSGSNIGSPSRLAKHLPDLCILGSESKTGALATQGRGRYLGFVGKGTCIPSRFAVDDAESPTSDLSNRRAFGDGDSVKQELHLDFTDSSRFGNSILPHFSANDPISLLSKDGLAGYFMNS